MSESSRSGFNVSITTGNVSRSQIAGGRDIQQRQSFGEPATPEDLQTLMELIAALRAQVAAESPAAERDAAVAKVDELAEAIAQPEPDLATMESVRNWFVRRLPALAGGVAAVVVNPIVGKLVAAAGDTLAGEFRRRFGV